MKKIPLSKGKFALVDDEDFEFVNQWKWYFFQRPGSNTYYAKTRMNTGYKIYKNVFMHRLIMKVSKSLHIDHINGDGFDNRKSNLRVVTHHENMLNRSTRINNTSGYPGIYKRENNKFVASISSGKKRVYLGFFSSYEEALAARKKAEDEYFGEFSKRRSIEISKPLIP